MEPPRRFLPSPPCPPVQLTLSDGWENEECPTSTIAQTETSLKPHPLIVDAESANMGLDWRLRVLRMEPWRTGGRRRGPAAPADRPPSPARRRGSWPCLQHRLVSSLPRLGRGRRWRRRSRWARASSLERPANQLSPKCTVTRSSASNDRNQLATALARPGRDRIVDLVPQLVVKAEFGLHLSYQSPIFSLLLEPFGV